MRIRDHLGHVAFDRDLEDPWLLVDLPPGRYEVGAVFGSQTRSESVTIRPGRRQQIVLRFDVPDDMAPAP